LILEIHVPESRSLKDKRHYVAGVRDRLRTRFNVSVAEIAGQEDWTRSTVAVAAVSGGRAYLEGLFQKVEDDAANFLGPFLIAATVEWL
jgi:uncharacterized protein YlxP (DUF503 family)